MTEPQTAQLLQQGLFHHRQGQIPLAMERYMAVLQADPENAEALYYVAVVACQEGQLKEGADLARRAIALGLDTAKVHNLLGRALDGLGQPLEAVKSFDRAIAADPNFAEAHGNRANILVDAGLPAEALMSFDRALALNPNSTTDLVNRGVLLDDLGQYAEALVSFDQAVAGDPTFAEAHSNRGNVLKNLGHLEVAAGTADSPRFSEALAAYDKAIEIDPRLAGARLSRSLLNLLRGGWEAGFPDYEQRTRVGPPSFAPLPGPTWDGELRPGERIVLVCEQGLGDTIQFCRFGPLLAARGFDVTILTRKAMAPLLATLTGVTVATDADQLDEDARPYRWLPLLSVPRLLGIRPDSLPQGVPYLAAEPDRVRAWAERLGAAPFKIGINWASGHSDKAHFQRRDLPLGHFAALAALPGVQLVSLQKGPAAAQIAKVAFRERIVTLDTDPKADADFFLDTAAVISGLDLVVTCDTSVAHLAGALGRPVFTALPAVADWRWLLGRADCPWYPTMRLFRQGGDRQWAPVVARIAEAARERIAVPPR